MGQLDSQMFDKSKNKVKEITLSFDENDDIMPSVIQAMKENKINKATILSFKGKLKDATINYFQKSQIKSYSFIDPKEVIRGNGEFKLDPKDGQLFGRIRMNFNDNGKTAEGILIRGIACDGLTLILQYVDM